MPACGGASTVPEKVLTRTTLAFDNSVARIIDGTPGANNGTVRGKPATTPWTLYEFELPVGKTASNINLGCSSRVPELLWFDPIKVELDGEPYSNPRLDFDFKSPNAKKGFYIGCGDAYTNCTDYKVVIDGT